MNLLHTGSRPEPKPAHNCKTWFPNGKNPFEKIKWEEGRFVAIVNYRPSLRLITSKTRAKTSKHLENAEYVLQEFKDVNFSCEEIYAELKIDAIDAYQIIQFLLRYSKIEKVCIVAVGKKRVQFYKVVK